MKNLSSIIGCLLLTFSCIGQCLDSLQFPNTAPPCYPDFIPVCGCDGVTYQNSCYADYATVLNYAEGPCDQIAIDLYPNPSSNWMSFTAVTKYESDVNLYIFDRNGNVYYYRDLTNVTSETLSIPVYEFEQGLYIIMAESNGEAKLLKFIRWEE
jgi:hypothetical protein